MTTARTGRIAALAVFVAVMGMSATAWAGNGLAFLLGSGGRGGGHYETRIERVLVEAGHYEIVRTPEQRTTYVDRYGRRHIVITPARNERIWVAPRYREVVCEVWVATPRGHAYSAGCGCSTCRPTVGRGRSDRRYDSGIGLRYTHTSRRGGYSFSIRF